MNLDASDRYSKPSGVIRGLEKRMTPNNVRYHNEKWFLRTYYNRKDEPRETHSGQSMKVGTMYTFDYSNPKYKEELDFYNALPVSICLGHVMGEDGSKNMLGLNVTFIPPKIRVMILDALWKIFRTTHIEDNIDRIFEGNPASLKDLPLYYDVLKKILDGSGFEFAVRSYIYKRIKTEPRIISLVDWWRIATFTSQWIKKVNIRAIYYWYKRTQIDEGFRIGKIDPKVKIKTVETKELEKYIKDRNSNS